jgi:hypothetical protein
LRSLLFSVFVFVYVVGYLQPLVEEFWLFDSVYSIFSNWISIYIYIVVMELRWSIFGNFFVTVGRKVKIWNRPIVVHGHPVLTRFSLLRAGSRGLSIETDFGALWLFVGAGGGGEWKTLGAYNWATGIDIDMILCALDRPWQFLWNIESLLDFVDKFRGQGGKRKNTIFSKTLK